MQTSMPHPIKINHDIFAKDPKKSEGTGGMPPKNPLFKRSVQSYSPIDGRPMWDSIEYLEDGTPIYVKGKNTCIFFCIHGAGHSALSFTLLAQELQEFATTVAYDIRGHGYSKHPGGEADLSIETLVDDARKVFESICKKFPESTFIILGHSMGGSIAVRLSKQLETSDLHDRVVGVLMVDVVEGTAMEYLPFMLELLSNRPKSFKSEEDAIKYAIQTKSVMNIESGRISIPPQLKEDNDKMGNKFFTWKNDLPKSEPFWLGWFKGLSSTFLSSKVAKICFIAARERLDKELEIANMQGKFKLVTFPNVGHCMMEDDPVAMAKNCHLILDRFRCALSMADVNFIKEKGVPAFHGNLKPYCKN